MKRKKTKTSYGERENLLNIILIGFRGTGKTTIGKMLAQRLGKEFVDADEYLEQKEGKSVKDIFAEGGEKLFGEIEYLLEHRRPLYDRTADFVINTTSMSAIDAANKIITFLHSHAMDLKN